MTGMPLLRSQVGRRKNEIVVSFIKKMEKEALLSFLKAGGGRMQ